MKKLILNILYKHYKNDIHDMFISEMYGFIPHDLRKPSIEFLLQGKEKLERFFSIQAYEMKRRALMDPKHAEQYDGILIHIKSLLVMLSAGVPTVPTAPVAKKIVDPDAIVSEFVKQGKEFISAKKQ